MHPSTEPGYGNRYVATRWAALTAGWRDLKEWEDREDEDDE